jgi:hypothetical protein
MRLVRSTFMALALSLTILGSMAVATTTPVTGQETVYVTKSGKKYHTATCNFVKNGKTPMKLADAVKAGYTPCSVCNPPKMTAAAK